MNLLRSIGIEIGPPEDREGDRGGIFLTNAVLCLKPGKMQDEVRKQWFDNCGRRFLKPLIELLRPKVVVCLGEWAYRSVEKLYGLRRRAFREVVRSPGKTALSSGAQVFAVYHCGSRIQNTHRKLGQQLEDWVRIGEVLNQHRWVTG